MVAELVTGGGLPEYRKQPQATASNIITTASNRRQGFIYRKQVSDYRKQGFVYRQLVCDYCKQGFIYLHLAFTYFVFKIIPIDHHYCDT